jgi:hypothetical protein
MGVNGSLRDLNLLADRPRRPYRKRRCNVMVLVACWPSKAVFRKAKEVK